MVVANVNGQNTFVDTNALGISHAELSKEDCLNALHSLDKDSLLQLIRVLDLQKYLRKTTTRGMTKIYFNIHDNFVNSNFMQIAGAEWYVKIEKSLELGLQSRTGRPFNSNDFLRATIYCKRNSVDATINASYKIRLIGSKNAVLIKGNHCFKGEKLDSHATTQRFIKWNDIMDPFTEFVDESNKLVFSVDICVNVDRVNVSIPDLFSLSFPHADCKLIVQDKCIPVSKNYLAIHSTVFKTYIAELLLAIYPTEYLITDANVGRLLRIADKFQASGVIDRCVHHLNYQSEMSLGQRLLLIQQVESKKLMLHCSDQCLSEKEVTKLRKEFHQLSSETMCHLLDGIYGVQNKESET
uniref:BTB domain-containing protein n=1 Tax=Ditylenchus dipsaci TaxID=166011 RepID=A0A915ENT6_9BILA